MSKAFLSRLSSCVVAGAMAASALFVAAPAHAEVKVGVSDWPGWVGWYVAEQKGFFKKHGADVKLVAVVGAFLGASAVTAAFIYTLLAGGLLSLFMLRDASVLTRVMANLRAHLAEHPRGTPSPTPLARTAARLPYAVAIAMGTAAALVAPPLV